MKLHTLKYTFLSFCVLSLVVACNNDDDVTTEPVAEVDPEPTPDPTPDPDPMMEPEAVDFSGTYSQVDYMGRPGINTVLNGDSDDKDAYNLCIPATMAATYQPKFEARLIALHAAYGAEYETNILGLDVSGITGVLASDVLEVSPSLPTTYFNPGEDNDGDDNPLTLDGDEIALTGRAPGDDVIDVSLILLFGGESGMRFSGQDTDDDGTVDLPRLTSDGVALTADLSDTFPYLGAPE